MHWLSLSGARRNILVVAALIAGVVGLALYFSASPGSFKKLSCQIKGTFSGASLSLADAGCESESSEDGETYFVSCGGFF